MDILQEIGRNNPGLFSGYTKPFSLRAAPKMLAMQMCNWLEPMVAWRVEESSGLVNQEPEITFVYMADTVILRQLQQLIRVKKYGNKYKNLLKDY